MPFTSSDSSFEKPFPSNSRRRNRVASSSLISWSTGTQRSVTWRQEYDGSHTDQPLLSSGKSHWVRSTHGQERTRDIAFQDLASSKGDGNGNSHATHRHEEHQASVDIFELPDDSVHHLTDSNPLLTTSQGVDLSSIPLDSSSRRTTIFVGHRKPIPHEAPHDQALNHRPKRHSSIEEPSKMHRQVGRDDYLLARGANPRTGVVTPGSHSANSSIDQGERVRSQGSAPPSRWKQKGDQWVSLNQDQQMPMSAHPIASLPEPHYYRLRTPPKLSAGNRGSSGDYRPPPGRGELQDATTVVPFQSRTVAYDPRQHGRGMETSAVNAPAFHLHGNPRDDTTVRRRPVGSPPVKLRTDHDTQGPRGTNDSGDTILKKPRMNTDLRSSSAPDPPRLRVITPYNVDKDLPTLPATTAFLAMEHKQANAAEESFLDRQTPTKTPDVPESRISNTCGRPMTEKELPCLPMSSGPSPLKQQVHPPPGDMRDGSGTRIKLPTGRALTPQGPRGGDPAYPYIRNARPPYPTRTTRTNAPVGERLMSIPVYDNPPKHPSPLTRMTVPKAEGPRSIPGPGMIRTNRPQDDPNPSSSTTTTSTDMFMNRPPVPRPLRIGPSPLVPDPRMMGRGRHGLAPRPPPQSSSDIIMNTGMSSNADNIMTIPLPRIRPRAVTRPAMPVRAEGMFGVPRVGPSHNRANTPGVEYPQMWQDEGTQSTTRFDPPESETDLVPPPLKLRQPSHDLARPKEVPIDSDPATNGLGLTRKCSRCHHGFVDVKLRNMDSAIPTSGRQKGDVEASEGCKKLHPTRSPLPGVPEDDDDEVDSASLKTSSTTPKANVVDERDHTICCPDCCKDEDCHEGCLGHPSPSSTSSPTKSIFSEAQSPSSASEVDDEWEDGHGGKAGHRGASNGLLFGKTPFRVPPKKGQGHSGSSMGGSVSPIELSAQPRTPATQSGSEPAGDLNGALAAALRATGSSKPKSSGHRNHRRQRSSSSPLIGVDVSLPVPKASAAQGSRAAEGSGSGSGSRLKVPTPVGLAIASSGVPKSRNFSGTSIATFELQVPGRGSLGYNNGNSVGDMILVPFAATKMWIQNHPHVTKLGWEVLERAWQMGQIMTTTGWRLWAVVFVYSKTGKLKLKMAKGETAGGFVVDCARSFLYLMVFVAVSVFIVRVLRVVVGVVGIVGWLFKALFWVLKQVLGFGLAC